MSLIFVLCSFRSCNTSSHVSQVLSTRMTLTRIFLKTYGISQTFPLKWHLKLDEVSFHRFCFIQHCTLACYHGATSMRMVELPRFDCSRPISANPGLKVNLFLFLYFWQTLSIQSSQNETYVNSDQVFQNAWSLSHADSECFGSTIFYETRINYFPARSVFCYYNLFNAKRFYLRLILQEKGKASRLLNDCPH